jgi:PRTRC genetic system protein E
MPTMFKELVPVLRQRAVLLTITSLEDDQIRVNIVPKKLKDGENNALTTPISITATADELDAGLSATLVSYVGSHLQLKNTLEKAKAEMDAAAKAAQAEARAKSKTPLKKETTTAASPKPVETAKSAEPAKPIAPKTASLFDMSPLQAPVASAGSTLAASESTEDDILAEIGEEESVDETEEELGDAA